MNILAICGSLRSQSRSLAILHAAQALAPTGVNFEVFESLGHLPLFNPEQEQGHSQAVQALREAIDTADAIVIASPEYAHGITGALKNALDWMVGYEAFGGMPVAVLNPSSHSHHADDSLKEILRTMSARLIPGACMRIPVIGSGIELESIASNREFRPALIAALNAITSHISAHRFAHSGIG